MSVEEARHVLTGDHIQLEDGGPTLMVICTHHSPSQSVITVLTDDSEMQVLEYLPDDPVFLAILSGSWDEETNNAND
jgi:hypothetical protein